MDQRHDPVDPPTERFPRINPTATYPRPSRYDQPQGWAPPQQRTYAPPPPAPAPKRTGRRILAWSAVGLFALFVIAGVSGNRDSSSTASTAGAPAAAEVPVVAEAPAAVEVPAAPVAAGIGDGTHIVGVDIEPGTYRSGGAEPGLFEFCAWFTREGASSNSDVIDFGSANADEPLVVEIDGSVGAFESKGCEAWTRVG